MTLYGYGEPAAPPPAQPPCEPRAADTDRHDGHAPEDDGPED